MAWVCSSVSELSRPPDRITPTGRPVSTRTAMLSRSAVLTSAAASAASASGAASPPASSSSLYGARPGLPPGLAQPCDPVGTAEIGAPTGTSALTSDATCRPPQLVAQFAVVEDLAVVAEQPALVRRDPRLARPLRVDDAQPLRSGEQPVAEADLLGVAARPQRVEHLAEHGRAGALPGDQGYPAHRGSVARARRGKLARVAGHVGTQAHVPRLAFVDDVDLVLALPVEQQPAQDAVRTEPAVPLHLDVGRVADAVRARQQRDIAQRLQVPLVLDAPGHAGDPQRRRAVRRDPGELPR